MGDEDNEVESSYNSVLGDLKINSKPLINVLTMMAEDHIKNAPRVVQTIERHLNSVHPTMKLPVLYLIDSIVKNVQKDYPNLFTQNVVSSFCGVFEKVDEKVKAQMFKLRQTWNDVFPQRKLYAIDVRCHQLDKNWPISAAPPSNASSIHVNPKFLNTVKQPGSITLSPSPGLSSPAELGLGLPSSAEPKGESDMREKLLQKQKELLELQQKKIELELLEMQNRAKKAKLESKRLEELESAMQQEKLLLNQAEMAKNKTHIAHQILSSVPSQVQQVPSNLSMPLISKTMPMSANDPRLDRQGQGHGSDKRKVSPTVPPGKGSPPTPSVPKKISKPSSTSRSPREDFSKSKSPSKNQKRDGDRSHKDKDKSKFSKEYKDKDKRPPSLKSKKEEEGREPLFEPRKPSDFKRSYKKSGGGEDDNESEPGRHGAKDKRKLGTHLHSRKDGSPTPLVPKLSRSCSTSRSPKEDFSSSSSPSKSPKKDRKDKSRSGKDKDKDKRSSAKKEDERESSFDARRSAVLKRNYRKTAGIEEEENEAPQMHNKITSEPNFDVDMAFKPNVVEGSEDHGPASKKPRSTIVDLFGREDVDLRMPPRSGNWSQVKKLDSDERLAPEGEDFREILQTQNRNPNRPLPASSPANSVSSLSSQRSGCDPLGRPRLYDKLPDDPEERKRSLDAKPASTDPLEHFKLEYIEKALNGKGQLSPADVQNIMGKARDSLNPEQNLVVMRQLQQINEASAMREVQQKQLQAQNWQAQSGDGNSINPWAAPRGPWVPGFGPPPTEGAGFPQGGNWVGGPMGLWRPPPLMGGPNHLEPIHPMGPNPFEEALVDDLIPRANELELAATERDCPSSIPIDKIMRQLRFYGDTAIVLMGKMGDDPRQISFKQDNQPRTIRINGKPMEIMLGEVKQFDLNRKHHTLKIGAPTRELYIDDRHYEVFFGGPPARITIDGRMHTFELTGKPPEVEIGKVARFDIIAGKVTLIVDAVEQLIVFLDEKPQKLDLFHEPVLLRFVDGFTKVLLNGRPFPTNFGTRLPFSVTIPNAGKHFLRFSALPPSTEKSIGHFIRTNFANPNRGRGSNRARGRGGGRRREFPEHNMPIIPDRNPLDMLNFLPNAKNTEMREDRSLSRSNESFHSYESDIKEAGLEEDAEGSNGGSVDIPDISNILAMAAKLGLLPASQREEDKEAQPILENSKKDLVFEAKAKEEEQQQAKVPAPPLPNVLLNSDKKEYMKQRRQPLIDMLWIGIQCASCGLRFSPDQALRYSQHLDWHFRRNRREKANYKKAHSRAWYYDLSDWIQFEEIEDLEERAASVFEIQGDVEGEIKNPIAAESPEECSVLASGHEGASCPQCGENFESFYDEEKEEWRLKDAILDEVDGESKIYHFVCHEDYLRSLVEETAEEELKGEEQNSTVDQRELKAGDGDKVEEEESVKMDIIEDAEDDDEVLILKEGKKEVVLMEIDVDDEDGVGQVKSDAEVENNKEAHSTGSENDAKISDSILTPTTMQNDQGPANLNLNPNYSIISKHVPSPIVINDDDSSSNLLPGIGLSVEDSVGGVFEVALNSGIRPDSPDDVVEEKRVVYKSMEFDFPKIKIEPADEVQEPEPEESLSIPPPLVPEVGRDETEPIDLTADDDEADIIDVFEGTISQQPRQMTAIDGNLTMEDTSPMSMVSPPKIRINISSLTFGAKSPSPEEEQKPAESNANESSNPSPNIPNVPNVPNVSNSESDTEIVFTDAMKELKPRLVGRKLVNCPPKQGNKEESGLCVIC